MKVDEPAVITTRAVPAPLVHESATPKGQNVVGWISNLFGLSNANDPLAIEQENAIRVQKIARVAYHVQKLNPNYKFSEEEMRALKCLDAFPQWLKATTSLEEGDQIFQALQKQAK